MDITTIIIIVVAVAVLILLCLCLAIANYAGDNFYARYSSMEEEGAEVGLSTLQFFNYINNQHFDNRIKLCQTDEGIGAGAYSRGMLFLTTRAMQSDSLASYCIVAHELGHAKQDFTSKKLEKMAKLRLSGKILGVFMFPLFIAGLILLFFGNPLFYVGLGLIAGGLLIFLLSVVIRAITINIEKEASQNAIEFLRELLNAKELKKCRKFLNDARLTYWADMFRALLGWTMLTRRRKK